MILGIAVSARAQTVEATVEAAAATEAPVAAVGAAVSPTKPGTQTLVRIALVKGYDGVQKFKNKVKELLGASGSIYEKEMSRGSVVLVIEGGGDAEEWATKLKGLELDGGLRPRIQRDGSELEIDVL